MIKKLLAVILSLLLVISVAACGKEAETSKSEVFSVSSTENEKTNETGPSEPTSTPTQEPTSEPTPALKEGESVYLGTYEQDNDLENGKEPIEWTIIDENENGYFVISTYVLDFKYFHHTEEDVTWETSDIRAWLNGEFYEENFTDEEKSQILLTTVDNSEDANDKSVSINGYSNGADLGYKQGNDTSDYIYLPSEYDLCQYFSASMSNPISILIFEEPYATSYAFAECAKLGSGVDIDRQMNYYNGQCSCLTRTMTDSDTCITNGKEQYVNQVYVLARSCWLYCYDYWEEPFGIRPVMWISK